MLVLARRAEYLQPWHPGLAQGMPRAAGSNDKSCQDDNDERKLTRSARVWHG